MPRRMEDVVPKKTMRIRKIDEKIVEQEAPRRVVSSRPHKEIRIVKEEKELPIERARRVRREKPPRKNGLWFVAGISLVFFLFALSFLFAKAHITVTPKTEDIVLNENITAVKNSSTSGVSFDLVIISGEESLNIEAEEKRQVSVPAKGTVIMYNNFSQAAQKLSIDTRLEGSNGKIYKTVKEITVPGMKADGTPGSIEVGIYGAEPGDTYNSGPLDFKVFGFKGTPRYDKFYARSKGEITGGLSGLLPYISPEVQASTVNELKGNLEAKLLKKVTEQIPEGFILFDNAAFLSVTGENLNYKDADDNKVGITLKGTLYGFLFNESKLNNYLVDARTEGSTGSEVYVSNLRSLKFTLPNRETISFAEAREISFNLSGNAKYVWRVDEEKFVDDILGRPKADFNRILPQYVNIKSADLRLRPFWKRSLPESLEDIELQVNYPE